jgi:hypothetical protein
MTTETKVFRSADSGAPTLSNTAGSLIALLDVIFVNGYGTVTLDSLVVSAAVATGYKSTGHGFSNIGTKGPVITIAGASPSGLNGDKRITVVDSTHFTFSAVGISNQTATGTITAKRSPLGWEKVYSGTNKAAYRSQNVQGPRSYLRIDDSATTYARAVAYESMSDVDTGTNPFPTSAQMSGGVYVLKATGASYQWMLVGDDRSLFFKSDHGNNGNYSGGLVFFEIAKAKSTDAYGMVIQGSSGSSSTFALTTHEASGQACYICRSITQAVGSVTGYARYNVGGSYMVSTAETYPPDADGVVRFYRPEIWEPAAAKFRGFMPGFYSISCKPAASMEFENISGIDGAILHCHIPTSGNTAWLFDSIGPWNYG